MMGLTLDDMARVDKVAREVLGATRVQFLNIETDDSIPKQWYVVFVWTDASGVWNHDEACVDDDGVMIV